MKWTYLQTAFLGDLLLSVPVFKRIRQKDPHSHITLVCRWGFGELFQNLGLCDEFVPINKSDSKQMKQSFKKISRIQCDFLLSPHQSFRSHSYVRAIKARVKVGYANPWNALYFSQRVHRNKSWPEALRALWLLTPLDSQLKTRMDSLKVQGHLKTSFQPMRSCIPEWASMALPTSDIRGQRGERKKLEEKISSFSKKQCHLCQPHVALAPGSVWLTKRWILKNFIQVGQYLSEKKIQVFILGSSQDKQTCQQIEAQVPGSISLAGRTHLTESLGLLSSCQFLITNDSGAMHLASVGQCPTVALFGPTVFEMGYGPWNPRSIVLENKSLPCRPCGQHGGHLCPIGTHYCMESISVDHVLNAVDRLQTDVPRD